MQLICFSAGTTTNAHRLHWIYALASATRAERSPLCSRFQDCAESLGKRWRFVDYLSESDMVASGWGSAHNTQQSRQLTALSRTTSLLFWAYLVVSTVSCWRELAEKITWNMRGVFGVTSWTDRWFHCEGKIERNCPLNPWETHTSDICS